MYFINRFYGAENYGNYAFYVSTLKMLGVVAVFGIDTFSLRHISEMITKDQWGSIRRLTRSSYAAIVVMSLVVGVVVTTSAVWMAPVLEVPPLFLVLLSLMVLPFALNNYHLQCFRSEKNILLFAGINFFLIPLLSVGFIALLGFTGWNGLENFWIPIGVHTTVILLISGLGILLWQRSLRRHQHLREVFVERPISGPIGTMWRYGFPFLLASTSVYFASWVIQFGLKAWSGAVELAIYDVSFRIGLLTILPLMAINAIAAPKFSGFYGQGNIAGLQRTAQYATLVTILVSTSIAAFIYLFPELLLDVFGEVYSGAVPVLLVITIAHLTNAVSGPNGFILLMSDHQELYKNIVLGSSLVTAIASIFLVREYGALGAAITYTIFAVLNNGFQIYYVYRRLGIYTFPIRAVKDLFRSR